jgi:hypothetical protein
VAELACADAHVRGVRHPGDLSRWAGALGCDWMVIETEIGYTLIVRREGVIPCKTGEGIFGME